MNADAVFYLVDDMFCASDYCGVADDIFACPGRCCDDCRKALAFALLEAVFDEQ